MVLRLGASAIGASALAKLGCAGKGAGHDPDGGTGTDAPPGVLPFAAEWRFGGPYSTGAEARDFDDSGFATIALPHSVVGLSWQGWDPSTWEKVWIYRRHFTIPDAPTGTRFFVDFEAAMTQATVWLDGTKLGTHLGGYLPFSFEITSMAGSGDHVLAVVLDSRFQLDVPPDRPDSSSGSTDFAQVGGLHRGVALRQVPSAFISDLFARPRSVLGTNRRIDVACTIDGAIAGNLALALEVVDAGGTTVASTSAPVTLVSGQPTTTVTATLTGLGALALWHVDSPNLYVVKATLQVDGAPLHVASRRIGLRDASFTTGGFLLNGSPLKLFGLCRHEIYPFAGSAMPDRVKRKDAEILRKTLNCNMVRCSHYPQSEPFLDACDELGLLVWQEAPGWGYIGDTAWKNLVQRDVHDMIVRDRNHPSIVLWGVRLNETQNDPLWATTQTLAKSLDPSRQTTGAMLGGLAGTAASNFQQDVFGRNDYSDDAAGKATLASPRTDFPYFVSETIGTLSGPVEHYTRTISLSGQQGQAYAHAYVHDKAASNVRYCGVTAWSGFDYPSPTGGGRAISGVKYTGVADLFRVPKLGAAIYQAQVKPSVTPVIVPAFYWDFGPSSPASGPGAGAMICSNCDRLEVFVGANHFATVQPDTSLFGHLRYPPFVLNLTVHGTGLPELRIDGYLGTTLALSRHFSSDPSTDVLSVVADDATIAADGVDATRVVFAAVDRYGAPRPYVSGNVTIAVDGPAQLIGDSPFDFATAGGVGGVWIRSLAGQGGTVTVTVGHAQLGSQTVTLQVS
jgi:beta-galactosidase